MESKPQNPEFRIMCYAVLSALSSLASDLRADCFTLIVFLLPCGC